MPSALLDAICADASARDASARLNSLSYLLLTPGHRSENKVIGLIFAEGQVLPRMIVKLPRTPEAAQSLRNEVTALRKLHALRLGGMPGVPHLLFYNEHGQCVMVGQTALAGQPIHVYVRRETFRPLALKVTNWLADLAINTAPQPRAVWWSRLAAPLLRDFEQNYGGVVEPAWIHAQRTLLDSLEHLPLVCEHRDFQLDNVYLSPDGEVQVLDWEAAELQGLPALDLIFFLAYLVFSLEHTLESSQALTETCKAYRRAVLDTTTFTGSVVAECLVHYAQRVGLDPAALRPLRVLAWLIPMRWQYLDHQSDAGGTPSPETLRQSLFINLWKEELSAALTAVHQ